MGTDETGAGLRQRLREAGLKVTAPRLAILETVQHDQRHPTVEEVHASVRERMRSLSLSTVYKTLETFLRHGLVRRVSGAGPRLRIDGVPREHDHAVCRQCGAIFDVERPEALARLVPPAAPQGMRVTGVRIEYDVICRDCSGDREAR